MDNIVDLIMDYEMGLMDESEMLSFFARLIKTGVGYKLQGSYGRTCDLLISSGLISTDGEIL